MDFLAREKHLVSIEEFDFQPSFVLLGHNGKVPLFEWNSVVPPLDHERIILNGCVNSNEGYPLPRGRLYLVFDLTMVGYLAASRQRLSLTGDPLHSALYGAIS